jgi:uncharacterized membrane protein
MELVQGTLAAGLVMGVIDAIWLMVIARKWMLQQLGHLMKDPISWPPAIVFYVLYSGALSFFAIGPAMAAGGDVLMALGLGAFLGLVAYGTYDLTNMATLKDWPRAFAIVDIIWGPFVSGVSAAGGLMILKLF